MRDRGLAKAAGGFTLVEVLVASLILATSAFGFLQLLRYSDYFVYKAKVEGKVATLLRTRVSMLYGMPFSQLVWLVNNGNGGGGFVSSGGNTYSFQNGVLSANGTAGFPFATGMDAVSAVNRYPYGSGHGEEQYLLEAKPLPGEQQRRIFPFQETVTLVFNDLPSMATSVSISYGLDWRDSFVEGHPVKSFGMSFTKCDDRRDASP